MNDENIKLAVVYVRVSTDDQKKEALSPEVQDADCKKAIEQDKLNGYKYLKTINDLGKSGGNLKRAGMQEMMELIKNEEIQAIYTIGSDRLSRNTGEYITLRALCKHHKVEIKYVHQTNIDDTTAVGKTMDEVLASFNQFHRLQTSEKVKDTLYAKAKAGYFPELAPLGYKNIKNPNASDSKIDVNIIVQDGQVAPLIKEMFSLYATGNFNGYDLCDLMYEKGLRTRPKIIKGVLMTPHKIAYSTFYELLRNKFYIGELKWGPIHVERAKHEPIIDKDIFDKVQQILEANNQKACRRRKYSWLLNGFLWCHKHNKRWTAEWHLNKGIAYYHCTNRTGCGRYMEKEEMEGFISDKFLDLEFNGDFIDRVIEKIKAVFFERREQYEAKKQGLVNQKNAFSAKLRVAEDKLFGKVISDEDFTRIRTEIKSEIANIEERLYKLERQQDVRVDVAEEILRFTKDIYTTYKQAPENLKKFYLGFFWDRFELQDGVIIKSSPSLLFQELLELQCAYYKNQKTKNPQLLGDSDGSDSLIIRDSWLSGWVVAGPFKGFWGLS